MSLMQMEEKIGFISEGYEIEGLFYKNSGDKGAVVTHPHPLYGGDMYNSVVEAIVRVYQKKGYSTLRFNFRGVGRSRGRYDNGIGEQKDVQAAILSLSAKGIKELSLAGYSFGTWVNSRINCEESFIQKMVMISPPVAFMDFQPFLSVPSLDLVITGSKDELAPADMIKKILPLWNPDALFEVTDGADHFYSGRLKIMESLLYSNI